MALTTGTPVSAHDTLTFRRELADFVSRRTFTGKEIVRALQKWDFQVIPGGGKGSHVKMRYVDPNTGGSGL